MSFDAHANFAYSTVATAPSPATSGTSMVVATGDGTKFPAVPFNATVWPVNTQPTTANAEIVRVTAISTDTFTITRTQESTSARSIGVGDQIAATITKKTLTDMENSALASGTSFPGSPADGDWFYRTDRNILYYYVNSLAKWLSVQKHKAYFTQSRFVNGSGSTGVWGWVPLEEDVYIDTFIALIRTGATNNGSNYWTVTFNVQDVATSGGSVVATVDSSASAASSNNIRTASYATVVSAASHPSLLASVAKTGTPSTPDFAFAVTMRSVG